MWTLSPPLGIQHCILPVAMVSMRECFRCHSLQGHVDSLFGVSTLLNPHFLGAPYQTGHAKCAKLLIEAGSDVTTCSNTEQWTPLVDSFSSLTVIPERDSLRFLWRKLLTRIFLSCNTTCWQMEAAANGHVDCLQMVLRTGTPDLCIVCGKDGHTALHLVGNSIAHNAYCRSVFLPSPQECHSSLGCFPCPVLISGCKPWASGLRECTVDP